MIHLHVRTEYSFRRAYGKVEDVLKHAVGGAMAMTDSGTWGHVNWMKACKKVGVKPIYGVELALVPNLAHREKSGQSTGFVVLLAKNDNGLRELYRITSDANANFYHVPRIDYSVLNAMPDDVVCLLGPGTDLSRVSTLKGQHYLMLTPVNHAWNRQCMTNRDFRRMVACDNHFPTPDDAPAYEILAQFNKEMRPSPMHLLTEDELRLAVPEATDEEYLNTERIAAECDAHLPRAENIKIVSPKTLREQCLEGAVRLGVTLDATYQARLDRELDMIQTKQFEDYFFLVGDLVRWAKERMLVGPARGSSAGSLVCYLLSITDVDPIVHDLMFERFIDITRADLPDIDIDFQDTRRELVIEYLRTKYGADQVGRIGTVARLKAKSAIGDVSKELGIPPWEVRDVQDAVIERSTGDARAQFCVADALESLEIGKALVAKYPNILIAAKLEGHAQHTGKHAAGVMVTNTPVVDYCSIDNSGTAQIDKKDAEVLNLLKIDALGLTTLSVIQDCLDQIGKDRDWLVNYPLTDEAAFEVLNQERYSGIFQFEGYALQSLCRQMKVKSFDDLQVIGALARPGPLHCGAATEFISRRRGDEKITHMHPLAEPITRGTYGIVIYQEQVMAMGRAIGNLSWEDVSELRKAMSKSLGEEFFNRYWVKFEAGAAANGISSSEARRIWDKMCTFGSWAFNKSHSVSYGLISYWCCVLKAYYPLEFAAAALRHVSNHETGIRILRDVVREGHEYKAVDVDKSQATWAVVDGVLLGGLTNIKGLGAKKVADILARRADGRQLLPGQRKLLSEAHTPYDDIFTGERRFGDLYKNPRKHHVTSGKVWYIADIADAGDYVFLGKISEKNLRDLNEYGNLVKRGMRVIKTNPLFLNMTIEDDTGSIICKVGRFEYNKWGKPLIEKAKIGDWFMWKGRIKEDGWRMVMVERWRCMEEGSDLFKPAPGAVVAAPAAPAPEIPLPAQTTLNLSAT